MLARVRARWLMSIKPHCQKWHFGVCPSALSCLKPLLFKTFLTSPHYLKPTLHKTYNELILYIIHQKVKEGMYSDLPYGFTCSFVFDSRGEGRMSFIFKQVREWWLDQTCWEKSTHLSSNQLPDISTGHGQSYYYLLTFVCP